MTSQEEASSFKGFFQYVEDSGLRTYDGLVIQNASDIARESDRIRNQTNWNYLQEKHQKKRRQEEAIKRIGEDVAMATDGAYSGKHFRMGFMTMPAPQDRQPPPGQGFTVRSQSLHSVGGGDDDSNHNRKQPPPKPKRDPNTKLSSSSETVNGGSGVTKRDGQETKETLEQAEAGCHLYSEDYKKMPPPKPKRNPNTQLSTSFDESYIRTHGNKKSSLRWDKSSSQSQSPASRDTDDEEPVYIEMVGNILRELKGKDTVEDEQSESVYEEMKYPMLEDFLQDAQSAIMDPEVWSSRGSLCDIPPPFPNLLTHRPPLLVFPPAPAQCSPNSDESPLTPLDVTRLPMMDNVSYKSGGVEHVQSSTHHRKERDRDRERDRERDRDRDRDRDLPSTHTITSSGRSSAPPLPSNFYKSSGSTHGGHGYPRSQSACPSPVSMGRSLTPLSLKRPPPYDSLMAGGSMPRSSSSSSSSSQRAGEGGAKLSNSSSTHGSMQNVSMRSQTPTSPLDELNNLFTSSRQMMKKGSGGRKSRESEGDSRSLPRHDSKDRDGRSSPVSSRLGRSSVSPTMMLSGGGESKTVCKLGRSASTSGVPSPGGTPQRHLHESHHPALSQMPWLCGDATMMEMIEKKRILCREIKARQRPEKNLCKQDSMPILPSWKRKQPPPYSAPPTATAAGQSTTVFWDTAI
ncbi:neuronal tyrosine-phosphorylated phosphoinositide-3-kinase adapter 2 isoform X1 [Acanthopagrus latus]|uniref:neuronal tyrosine-phosphorylated phosphoinositide-3-kinase adapter 2 isoform X1 n=1 Tax=Acanthopagrus latus TaxID=8177 RepID=UPI00187CA899|nr:neuronal tyrosine-phosphorylated phosphoinositide-3-kinase adapter 2 isoform X1 [Acanthopagrus latus]XP_036935282.1 neuronal tyrosine-phosphorylated phosphoinositide-3-kinase adapter 2 isoform X1 [Acanthopagrus latus]XP_036935293.1 neuronal tyrosine-phosphorylated phosphoinositide-3-kinase adapter 2 isoform X1 [Acanthopagrus latus]XP_036935298.1 neuronal tyrosine-phosphorylated phosphoinositide-3-kinase adapter 2 isoform X1 [Acanthopagrus latus]XP_036935306.1 neuronal tyrosine-phosphorylated